MDIELKLKKAITTIFNTQTQLFIMEFIKLTQDQLKNKLFCTFSPKDKLDATLDTIIGEYTIMYSKIFVLESEDSDEYLCTYNIEVQDTTTRVLPNTILLHRKKETNTLYTINSLNLLIKSLNEGILDTSFRVEWQNYRNTVLLTQGDDLRKLSTKIHKIVNI
jgi:hypothetical protein